MKDCSSQETATTTHQDPLSSASADYANKPAELSSSSDNEVELELLEGFGDVRSPGFRPVVTSNYSMSDAGNDGIEGFASPPHLPWEQFSSTHPKNCESAAQNEIDLGTKPLKEKKLFSTQTGKKSVSQKRCCGSTSKKIDSTSTAGNKKTIQEKSDVNKSYALPSRRSNQHSNDTKNRPQAKTKKAGSVKEDSAVSKRCIQKGESDAERSRAKLAKGVAKVGVTQEKPVGLKTRRAHSLFLGVYPAPKHRLKWRAQIRVPCVSKNNLFLGGFSSEIEAALAYDEAVHKYGVNKPLNFSQTQLETLRGQKSQGQPLSLDFSSSPFGAARMDLP